MIQLPARSTLFPYTTLFRSLTESLVDGERSQSKSFSSCARIGRIFSFSASSPLRRSEERFSRNAETDIVCRLLLEKKNTTRALKCKCPLPDCLFHLFNIITRLNP